MTIWLSKLTYFFYLFCLNKFVLQCKTLYIYTMNSSKENKGTTITFRTSEDLKKKLETMAAKEHRTLSNLIEYLLEKATKEKK